VFRYPFRHEQHGAGRAPTLGAGPRPQVKETKTSTAVLKTLAATAIIPEADGADGCLQVEDMTSFHGGTDFALEISHGATCGKVEVCCARAVSIQSGKLAFGVVMS
jgi:hypothetical protein